MDVDLCSGDGTRRKVEQIGSAEGAMDVVPLEMYDSARAKIAANLRWLFAKAYGIDHIPEDLKDPFYTDQYEQEHIKPPVIRLLLSCELYCRVCALILKTEQAASLQSHHSVIQSLDRKGIYVVESDDTAVTEEDLAGMPIKMSAHIPMIDALMMAYTVEMISIEKVVASVERFSTFNPSKELPFDLEDAMVFWINKVNTKMREISEKEYKVKHHLLESPSHQKVRYRREHASGRHLPFFPLLEDLMRDVCDGAALLTVVHYYCPDLMKMEDICLKEVPSMADSLYNIQLLREFSNEYLNKSFYLTTEDILYSPLVLKQNMLVFIAELFWWFETVKPEFVVPRDLQESKDARAIAQPKTSRPSVPISNATKRSFLTSSGMSDSQCSPEICSSRGCPPFSPSHPLLPLRQRQQKPQGDDAGLRNRSNSLTQMDRQGRSSVVAWPDKRQRPVSTLTPFLCQSATESDADVASGDSVSLARSISKDSLASNVLNVTPKHQASLHQPASAPLRKVNGHGHGLLAKVNLDHEEESPAGAARTDAVAAAAIGKPLDGSRAAASAPAESRSQTDSFYLEPLLPAVLKPAKEKSVCLNKEEESGEALRSSGRSFPRGSSPAVHKKAPNKTFASTGEDDDSPAEPPRAPLTFSTSGADASSKEPSGGFYLHSDSEEIKPLPSPDPDLEDPDEEDDDLDEAITAKDVAWSRKCFEDDEEESAKLREDMNVREHEDKDVNGCSGRSSPCLSVYSQASSVASGSVRMTSFAERKAQQRRFGSNHDLRSSASSSQRTTPDGSESSGPLPSSWRFKRDQSPSSPLGGCGRDGGSTHVLASEMVHLRMQLEEKRRAIEHQKKKMEAMSARQRQKLGKAAFLHIVKKGAASTPAPAKAQPSKEEIDGENLTTSAAATRVDTPKVADKETRGPAHPGALEVETKGKNGSVHPEEELDLNECNRSIELLHEAISSIQQQMMQLSLQQDMMMKQNVLSPPGAAPQPVAATTDNKNHEPRCPEQLSLAGAAAARKAVKPSSGRSSRSKASELKAGKEQSRHPPKSGPETKPTAGGRSPRNEHPDPHGLTRNPPTGESVNKASSGQTRNASFRLHDDNARLPTRVDLNAVCAPEAPVDDGLSGTPKDPRLDATDGSGEETAPAEEAQRSRAPLIEVDMSELKDPDDEDQGDGEQKSVMGFFFKDEQKAEDELAKKRAAFLLKQQKKAEETRLRKQQLEAESELKRDETRRKAEEDRLRKEDEKTRRELIKQEYLRRKQQEIFEEQGLAKPKTPKPKQKHRAKAILREESPSADTLSKGSSSTPDNLSTAQSGSSLSLASAATNEADSVNSGGAGSQRCDSVESFPGSRNHSRAAERDWDNGSTASSIASLAEYTGPKLFKEPSAKSNKPIIHNAISHCCLAGKVNEPQKNQILEELEKCESNHLMILFRDGGCQFRALYSNFPDTEEIHKVSGTGPKSIGKKMIDKLYKYNSDRKQFTVIPAKTVSASVDALTIHNHLWQVKKGAPSKRSAK
ncbi:calmodulin-regulated spectrin-associated protein 1-B isoform X2 [Stigmatopora argus]